MELENKTISDKVTTTGIGKMEKKNGEGVMKYINSDIYSGKWKNGKKDG